MKEKWHGTPGGYSNHRCRCDACRTAWNLQSSTYRRRRRANYVYREDDPHGTEAGYQRGCTCIECKRSHAKCTIDSKPSETNVSGTCEICAVSGLVVWDHDHKSGGHRGWLCINCNQGLGCFQDNISLLGSALYYLLGDK